MPTDPSQPLVSRLVAERIEAHRRYNEALTALDRAIHGTAAWPAVPPEYDERMLPAINDALKALGDGAPVGGSGWRGRLAEAVWQVVSPHFARQMAFNSVLVDHLNRNVVAHRDLRDAVTSVLPAIREGLDDLARFESLLVQFLQQITPLVDAKDREVRETIDQLRHVAEVAQRTATMAKRELERGGVARHSSGDAPVSTAVATAGDAYKYLGFEDRFRGSEDEIRVRLSIYVPLFEGASDVLDVGCGRGEFLDLLRQAGITAAGLDLNPEMVEACVARGLVASHVDALTYLRQQPDESLGGLIAVQVIEHLEPAYWSELLQLAFYKLRPGSRLILETINPACWVAFFESYLRDLTHVKPIHPETLQYMLHASGFSSVELIYRSPIAPEGRLQQVTPPAEHFGDRAPDPVAELASAFNRNMDRLNSRMFTFQDFAAVATKS